MTSREPGAGALPIRVTLMKWAGRLGLRFAEQEIVRHDQIVRSAEAQVVPARQRVARLRKSLPPAR